MKIWMPFLLGCCAVACAVSQKSASAKATADMLRLKNYMTGTFNSAAQAARDSLFFNITLHMYPIWQEKYPGEHWLYVEQTVTNNPQKPYRQRIYRLEQRDALTFVSHVYTLPRPKDFVLAWQQPERFNQLNINDLELKSGCEVFLRLQRDGTFSGSTGEKTCPSELRGASYATSKVTITPERIVSWDQGFDEHGKQVWGAIQSGYEFVKQQ